jgi:GT2 family glycosyltransferase
MTPLVDIVLLNYNGWRHTIECLESVFRLERASYRVLLVDNGSTDDSLDRIRAWANGALTADVDDRIAPEIRRHVVPPVPKPIAYSETERAEADPAADAPLVILALGRNGGFAFGNNAGMRFSRRQRRAEYLWLLNNDTVVAPDALAELVRVAESQDRIGAVGGSMLHYDAPEVVQFGSGATVQLTTGAVTRVNQGGVRRAAIDAAADDFNFVCGGCLLVRAAAVDAIGFLDERFFIYAEDSDYCLRISNGGWKMAYAANAFVWHKGGGTMSNGSPFHDYHNLRSSLLLVHKWRRRRVPIALAYWLYRAVAPKIWRRQWHRLPAVARAYSDAVRYMRSA